MRQREKQWERMQAKAHIAWKWEEKRKQKLAQKIIEGRNDEESNMYKKTSGKRNSKGRGNFKHQETMLVYQGGNKVSQKNNTKPPRITVQTTPDEQSKPLTFLKPPDEESKPLTVQSMLQEPFKPNTFHSKMYVEPRTFQSTPDGMALPTRRSTRNSTLSPSPKTGGRNTTGSVVWSQKKSLVDLSDDENEAVGRSKKKSSKKKEVEEVLKKEWRIKELEKELENEKWVRAW